MCTRSRLSDNPEVGADTPSSGQGMAATFAVDKLIELDFDFIKEELQNRTEFNRRILSLQISIITGVLAAGVLKDFAAISPLVLQVSSVALLFINSAFLLEVNQNNFYITLAAQYLHTVINKRAECLSGHLAKPYEWETFLAVKRDRASSMISRLAFVLDGHLMMTILFLVVSAGLFLFSFRSIPWLVFYVSLPCAFLACFVNVVCIFRHFAIPRELRDLHDPKTIDNFKGTYNLK